MEKKGSYIVNIEREVLKLSFLIPWFSAFAV